MYRAIVVLMTCMVCLEAQVFHYTTGENKYTRKGPFMWGVATSAFEIEGAALEDGKGPSVWDMVPTEGHPVNNEVTCDSYHRYKRDVQMLRQLGVHHYRFSLSWSRILPTGKLDNINSNGVRYYKRLIHELLKYGITPFVTLYHFDLPRALQDEGGWLNDEIIHHFDNYAKLCFKLFGKQVKHWVTINEPGLYSKMAYEFGIMMPRMRGNGTLVYRSAHNMLLSHATAYRTYQREFKQRQKGQIGIALEIFWPEPKNPHSVADQKAARRSLDFEFGWFADPLMKTGDYPAVMKTLIGENSRLQNLKESRLPTITPRQQELIKGAYDFIGLNMYSSHLVSTKHYAMHPPSLNSDRAIELSVSPDWERVLPWLCVTPFGLRKSLMYIRDAYDNPPVFIMENGIGDMNGSVHDLHRVNYHSQHIDAMSQAINAGCDVRGYTAWTLMDSFNYLAGYKIKFGFFSVDFSKPDKPRTPKLSAKWYATFIRSRRFLSPRTGSQIERSPRVETSGQSRDIVTSSLLAFVALLHLALH